MSVMYTPSPGPGNRGNREYRSYGTSSEFTREDATASIRVVCGLFTTAAIGLFTFFAFRFLSLVLAGLGPAGIVIMGLIALASLIASSVVVFRLLEERKVSLVLLVFLFYGFLFYGASFFVPGLPGLIAVVLAGVSVLAPVYLIVVAVSRSKWLVITVTMIPFLAVLVVAPAIGAETREKTKEAKKMTVGAYYFDGWAGRSRWSDDPKQPWAKDAPMCLTKRMLEEFSEREPLWGWRDDSLSIMERQIDLAADHGLAFFAFCWYWYDNGKSINPKAIQEDPRQTGLELYLKAKNNRRLKFCLLVANHRGFEIKGTKHWKQASDFWMTYLKHPQHVTVGGKPLVIIFNHGGGDKAGFAYLQERARSAGLPGVAIAGCAGGALETGYTHRTNYVVAPGYTTGSEQHKYAELMAANRAAWGGSREQPYMPIVTAGWDKRPWEGPTGLGQSPGWYYPDRTPEQFAGSLRDASTWMDKHPEQTTAERIVLIYSWNEYGEGGYVAPTKGDPDGKYLNAVRSVVMPAIQPGQPVAPADADKPRR